MFFVDLFLAEMHSKKVLCLHLGDPDCQREVVLAVGVIEES